MSQTDVAAPIHDRHWRDAAELMRGYLRWLAPVAEVVDPDEVRAWTSVETEAVTSAYSKPGCRLLLARRDGVAVGIVGLRNTETDGRGEVAVLL